MLKLQVAFILLFLTLAVYADSLTNDFVFDDRVILVNNPSVRNLSLLPKVFSGPTGENYYRPLQVVSYFLEHRFWKSNPAGYRLDNILLHWANGFLVFLVIGAVLNARIPAMLAAALFCVHPINAYQPLVISARAHLLETLFALLAIFAFARFASSGKKYAFALSLIFFVLALLSQESALLLPLFILLCASLLSVGVKKAFFYLIPYAVIAAAYLLLRGVFLPCDKLNAISVLSLHTVSSFIWFLQSYAGQCILPFGAQRMLFGNSALLRSLFPFFSFAITAYFFVRAFAMREKFSAAGALWYITGLLPVIGLLPTIALYGPVLSEHYAYMASVGFFVFIAGAVTGLQPRFTKVARAVSFTLIAFYAGLTAFNNPRYKDEITFYRYLQDVSPGQAYTRVNLAIAYYRQRMYAEAFAEARSALAADPGLWEAYLVQGDIALAKGELGKAQSLFERVIAMNPSACEGYNNLGCIFQYQGRHTQAKARFEKAIALSPEYLDAMHNLALLYGEAGDLDNAMSLWKRALALDPEDKAAQINIERIKKKRQE
jgi:protein O-mannosyl-transferase